MEVNFCSLGNEEEESKPIYKTYIMQGTKFSAMVHREFKKKDQKKKTTKMPNCSYSFFEEREKLTNTVVRSLSSTARVA